MAAAFTPYIIYREEGDGINWPVVDTTSGRQAVVCFTSGEMAKQFIKDKDMGPEWGVGMMEQPEFLRWLQQNLLNGTPLIALDPSAAEGRVVEIFRFLAEIEDLPEGGQA